MISPPRELPLEVLYMILDALGDDPQALSLCTLLCHRLHSYVRPRLYRVITLCGKDMAHKFSTTVGKIPGLGPLVCNITLTGLNRSRKCIDLPLVCLTMKLLPFTRLATLRSLTLECVYIDCPETLFSVLFLLTKLEELRCLESDCTSNVSPTETSNKVTRMHRSVTFPAIKKLYMSHSHSGKANLLVDGLLLFRNSICVTNLDIIIASDDQVWAWTTFIEDVGWKLRHLAVSFHRLLPHYSYLLMLDAVAMIPLLRSLSLTSYALVSRSASILISGLCHMFEEHPAPLTSLERLRLGLIERNELPVEVDDALYMRLARALSAETTTGIGNKRSRTRLYPRFGKLEIRVSMHLNVKEGAEEREKAVRSDKEAMLGRWGKALGGFKQAIADGVRFDVDWQDEPQPSCMLLQTCPL